LWRREGGGGLQRAGDAAPSMAAVRQTRGRRETGLLGDWSGVSLEGRRFRESERGVPGVLKREEGGVSARSVGSVCSSAIGQRGRRLGTAGKRREGETIPRQYVKGHEARLLARYEVRRCSVGWGGRVSRGRTPGVRHRVGLQSGEIAAMRKVTNTRAQAGFDH
jgi:hypothetical protein